MLEYFLTLLASDVCPDRIIKKQPLVHPVKADDENGCFLSSISKTLGGASKLLLEALNEIGATGKADSLGNFLYCQ